MYARASASQFLPHISASSQSLVVVSMPMDAYLERSRMVPFLSGWGHRKGGLGGGEGAPAQNLDPPSTSFFLHPPGQSPIFFWAVFKEF